MSRIWLIVCTVVTIAPAVARAQRSLPRLPPCGEVSGRDLELGGREEKLKADGRVAKAHIAELQQAKAQLERDQRDVEAQRQTLANRLRPTLESWNQRCCTAPGLRCETGATVTVRSDDDNDPRVAQCQAGFDQNIVPPLGEISRLAARSNDIGQDIAAKARDIQTVQQDFDAMNQRWWNELVPERKQLDAIKQWCDGQKVPKCRDKNCVNFDQLDTSLDADVRQRSQDTQFFAGAGR
jgi:hypothetical protein